MTPSVANGSVPVRTDATRAETRTDRLATFRAGEDVPAREPRRAPPAPAAVETEKHDLRRAAIATREEFTARRQDRDNRALRRDAPRGSVLDVTA